jgi:hypothetical protein
VILFFIATTFVAKYFKMTDLFHDINLVRARKVTSLYRIRVPLQINRTCGFLELFLYAIKTGSKVFAKCKLAKFSMLIHRN